jgi:hypothetical protein
MVKRHRLAVLVALPIALLTATACTEQTGGTDDTEEAEETDGAEQHPDPADQTVPNVPDPETARTQLGELTVEPEGEMTDYERDLFPHWSEDDGCSTRETVLERDGTDVVPGSDCYPESGTWYSQYDGVTLESAPDVDIDHVVALAEAWRSGADAWTTDRREAFANDLDNSQLIAVSAESNRSKGDQDPADWQPPVESYHCTYARMWIGSKHTWELSVDPDELTALETLLDTC